MRIVVALGGNALLQRSQAMEASVQMENAKVAMAALAPLLKEHSIALVHGNGPQVGLLALQNAAYREVSPYPLDVLGAESQGMIGTMLQQSLLAASPGHPIASLLTHVIVDANDPAFLDPSKFIGPQYQDLTEVERLKKEKNWVFKQDGHWPRRVVPSPLPKMILEMDVISSLLEKGVTTICCGGGGIPLVKKGSLLEGIEVVIDKDRTAALLAVAIEADVFCILSDVEYVYENFGTPEQKILHEISAHQLKDNPYPKGSMGPKIDACMSFVQASSRPAFIGSLDKIQEILAGHSGTRIVP